MRSTILITFIRCGPNKWNNQGPLIDVAGGCMAVLKERRGRRRGSPREPCAVINETSTATNYTHMPKRKGKHTHMDIQNSPVCPLSSVSAVLPQFHHSRGSNPLCEETKCCECFYSSDALSRLFSSPPLLSSFPSQRLVDYWKSLRSGLPGLKSNFGEAFPSD